MRKRIGDCSIQGCLFACRMGESLFVLDKATNFWLFPQLQQAMRPEKHFSNANRCLFHIAMAHWSTMYLYTSFSGCTRSSCVRRPWQYGCATATRHTSRVCRANIIECCDAPIRQRRWVFRHRAITRQSEASVAAVKPDSNQPHLSAQTNSTHTHTHGGAAMHNGHQHTDTNR